MKPIIISTGIAELDDIQLAIDACHSVGNKEVALLKCTSSYPAPIDEANLSIVHDLSERFNVISGLSDHTMGFIAPIISIAFGAKIIEKHFILDKSIGGPDSSFSMDPTEFKEMVEAIRAAESSIGTIDYSLTKKQRRSRDFSRSLFAVEDIELGEKITLEKVKSIRPGYGLHPKFLDEILGLKANRDISRGTPLDLIFFEMDD